MRDYYYFKEIFIGLREEYIKNQLKLQNLEKYIKCIDKRIKNFYLAMDDIKDNKLQICFNKKEQLNFIKRLLYDNYSELEDECFLIRDVTLDDIYIKNNNNKFELDSLNLELLKEEMDALFQTDFTKNIDFSTIISAKDFGLFLRKNKIHLVSPNATFVYYCNNQESINFNHFSNENMINTLLDLLEYKIPKDKLPFYHQEIIDKNKDLKDIYILGEQYNKQSNLLNIIDNNGTILCKKKIKRCS